MPEIAYVDNISATIFTPQISNFKKLERISMLQDNWDGYGAKPLPYDTIYKAQQLIRFLHIQPEIFPTATGNIQLEYEKDNGDYLELQFNGKGCCEVFRVIGDNEVYFTSPDNPYSINSLVDDFYERSF